ERGEPLEAEGEALRERGAALEKEGAELQAQKAALEARGAALQKKGEEISALAVTDPAAAAVQAAALQAESDELAAEGEELAKKADDLQARADALKAEGDNLQTRADALQAEVSALEERVNALKEESDRLEERGDALKAEGDELEAQGDALEERLKALGVEDTDELDDLVTNKMTDFVPEFANQAIHFATDDFGSDKTMSEYFLIIFVIILAFIFGITAKNDVRKDAAVIGTLRASGYTRGELIFHYAASPVLVTLLAAIAGNILGYTVFKYIVVNMYYGSYSLPAYVTVYDPQAFVKTSVVPVIIMSAVTVLMIAWKMRLSPLKFMRHDLSTSKRRKAVRLPKWSFLDRFRTRIFLRSIGDYIVMFVGLFFVMVMLCFCLGMPSTLDNFIRNSDQMVIADYQTVLTSDEDENEIVPTNGEKFMMIELESVSKLKDGEQITVYGFSPDSKYLNEGELTGTQVSVSAAYAEKFRLNAGDTIELKEKYSTDIFKFDVARISGRQGSLAVYMPIDAFEDTFDDGVVGYFSDTPLEGVDEEYIAKVITEEDISAMANQLNHSIGGYMKYFAAVCLIIAAAVLYLLTKQIIEKNTVSISMAKVLGYYNKEINSIYIRTTTICVIVMTLISVAAGGKMVDVIWRAIMMDMSGWFTYEVFFKDVVTAVTGTILVYLLIAFADMRRIKRIPMAEALKNAE
ncbi:MAG: hypothetical protein IJ080_00390, partial [Oscillospiraceae bacterium]|nr:hypothetical protein [Oscillospiraceae bacterium]